jgi:hypothetical protein
LNLGYGQFKPVKGGARARGIRFARVKDFGIHKKAIRKLLSFGADRRQLYVMWLSDKQKSPANGNIKLPPVGLVGIVTVAMLTVVRTRHVYLTVKAE